MYRESVRHYQMADSEMLIVTGAIRNQFVEHKDDFFEFDPARFNDDYIKRFDDSIAAAHNIGIDVIVVGNQTVETANVQESMDECVEAFDDLKYFVVRTWPDAPAKHNQFGIGEFSHARRSNARFVLFMEAAAGSVVEHRAELMAAGCRASVLDRVIAGAEALCADKVSQKEAIRSRPVLTSSRIDVLNAAWDFPTDIEEASRRIFRDKPEFRILFKLPVRKSDAKEEEEGTEATGKQEVID